MRGKSNKCKIVDVVVNIKGSSKKETFRELYKVRKKEEQMIFFFVSLKKRFRFSFFFWIFFFAYIYHMTYHFYDFNSIDFHFCQHAWSISVLFFSCLEEIETAESSGEKGERETSIHAQ